MGAAALLLITAVGSAIAPPSARRGATAPDHFSPPAASIAQQATPPEAAQRETTEVIVEIRFRGNYSISDEELLEAVAVVPGEPITDSTLDAIEERLRAYEGVGDVEILKRYRSMSRTDEVVLLVNVQESVAVSEKFMFLPIFTWTDEYGVTFGARFATVDLLGADERLSFPLTWGGERRAAAEIGFDIDRAALSRIDGGFAILQRENPHFELADRRVSGWIDARKRWQRFVVGGTLRIEGVDFGEVEANQLEVGLHAAIDTRQDEQLPRDAFYLGGAWDHLTLLDSDQDFNRFTADLRGYKRFIGRTIVAAQAYWRGADGRLPDWERPFLGGAQTVRGYDAGAFIGDNIALLSAEWRVPITPPVPVGLVGFDFFFDSGAVYDHGTSLGKARFKSGVGGGIYFFAAFVGLQVDVAYGLDSDEVHFHFSTGFRF